VWYTAERSKKRIASERAQFERLIMMLRQEDVFQPTSTQGHV